MKAARCSTMADTDAPGRLDKLRSGDETACDVHAWILVHDAEQKCRQAQLRFSRPVLVMLAPGVVRRNPQLDYHRATNMVDRISGWRPGSTPLHTPCFQWLEPD